MSAPAAQPDSRNQAHDGSASLPYTSARSPALPSGYGQAGTFTSRDARPSISPTLSTRSAPASPVMRPKPSPGLAPLSQIAPVGLSSNQSTQNGHAPHYQRKSSQPLPQRPPLVNGHTIPNGWANPYAQPVAKATGTIARAGPSALRSRGRSRRSAVGISSSSDTETEVDSDSTFVPGRMSRHKHSLSQPDLVALRSRLEGWAGDVARGQPTDKRSSLAKARATPPSNKVSLPYFGTFGTTSPHARSHVSLTALRKSPSPRSSPLLTPMTPVLSSTSSEGSSPMTIGRTMPTGGVTGSDDADDDDTTSGTGTDSPSSDSLSFSPRKTKLRHRLPERNKSGLGLSLDPSPEVFTKEVKPEHIPAMIERTFQQSTLLPLRLLAIVPSMWGICVLLDALVSGRLWIEVWPWGVDLSPEALERLVAGGISEAGSWRMISRGDMALCIAWALCTAHFCFELTTGLTHRWRSYYPLLSTLLRLLSLQCLCWPATYLTLWVLGARRPLLAWVVIGVTTGWSRTVQMWVTSNVVTTGEMTPKAKRSPVLPPEGLPWVESFTWGRKWDWDAIAREVGWKVGGLLLVTAAWMFWGFESGRYVELDQGG